jgi:hypothetical protein
VCRACARRVHRNAGVRRGRAERTLQHSGPVGHVIRHREHLPTPPTPSQHAGHYPTTRSTRRAIPPTPPPSAHAQVLGTHRRAPLPALVGVLDLAAARLGPRPAEDALLRWCDDDHRARPTKPTVMSATGQMHGAPWLRDRLMPRDQHPDAGQYRAPVPNQKCACNRQPPPCARVTCARWVDGRRQGVAALQALPTCCAAPRSSSRCSICSTTSGTCPTSSGRSITCGCGATA